MDLRTHTLAVERLEQSASEKAGLRARLIDTAAAVKDAKEYGAEFADQLIEDMRDDIEGAARLGVELGRAIKNAKAKA